MIQKTHKYRIYPNREQRELLEKHFGSVRWVYNWGLEKKVRSYQENEKRISCFDLIKELTKLKKIEDFQWLNEVNSQSLQMALRNLDNAFTNFFRKQNKFPQFKSKKNNRQGFQIPQHLRLDNKLTIPKIPNIKIKLSRKIEGKIKTATISKTPTNKYFISILVEQNKELPLKPKIKGETTMGVDFGIKTFATISDSRKLDNPKFLDKSLKQLKRQQRWLSRKVKGSNNRNKQRQKVALVSERVRNQRSDFLHKFSYRLTHEKQVESIAIEDLNVSEMIKNHHLARVISDVAWREARRQLAYKCDWYGRNLLVIGRFEPSSKICSCGAINHELRLADREWICPVCGTKHDRDLLASQNIKKFALIGSGRPESTLVESRGSKAHSLKQESLRL